MSFPADFFNRLEHVAPADIEKTSFSIIERELKEQNITLDEEFSSIIKRVIHTTADFEYAETLKFSPGVLQIIKEAILSGADIVTDTNMALSGINKKSIARFGGEAHCFMADDDVAFASKESGLTRAACSVDKTARFFADGQGIPQRPIIFVCGNAPTALVRVRQLHDAEIFSPALVIGVPVGFVNVVAA